MPNYLLKSLADRLNFFQSAEFKKKLAKITKSAKSSPVWLKMASLLRLVQELKETDFVRWKDFYKQFLYLQLPKDKELFLVTRHTSN